MEEDMSTKCCILIVLLALEGVLLSGISSTQLIRKYWHSKQIKTESHVVSAAWHDRQVRMLKTAH